MPKLNVILCPTLESAQAYCNEHPVAATVEAEYGDKVVEGDLITLAHHGPRTGNPAPCNDPNATPLPEGSTVVVSHLDLDTVGGLMALAGNKPHDPAFWDAAEYIDVKGPHHMVEIEQPATDKLNAFYCENGKERPPRYTEPTDVTAAFEKMSDMVNGCVLESDPRHADMIEAGKQWVKERDAAVQSCLVSENDHVRAFITDGTAFCAAAYANPDTGEIKDATVTLNTKFNSITVAFADDSLGLSAKNIVQELWGPEAGGRDGIAGSPRGQAMTEEDFHTAVNKVSELCEEAYAAWDTKKYYNFEFRENPDGITLTRYTGNGNHVDIPEVVNGMPVTKIGTEAFAGNESLKTVSIPDSVDIIEHAAFAGCRNLQGIDFPDKTITLDQRVFEGCDKLPPLNEQNFFYRYDPFDDHHVDIPDVIPDVIKLDDHHVDIPNVIPDVILPQGVKMIGEDNDGPSLNMPNVERKASQGLEFKVLDDGTCEVAGLGSCTDTDIVVPADDGEGHKVTSIGYAAFWGCQDLTSITIPDGVTSIGASAFQECTGLTNITIPDSVESIGSGAFFYCEGLTSITIPDSVTSIGGWAFARCTGLTDITIPDSVTSIGNCAFHGCTGLTSITIPDSVTSIGIHAFSDCTGLTSITIGNSVTRIGDYAFEDCTGLTSITIPDSVSEIGRSAFSGCDNLQIVCSAEMKEDLSRNREFYAISDNVNIITPEDYAAKKGPSLDDD